MGQQKLSLGFFERDANSLAIPTRHLHANDHRGKSSQKLLEVIAVLSGPDLSSKVETLRAKIKEGKNLQDAFASLNDQEQNLFRKKIGERPLSEILSMSGEADERVFHHNLLQFGMRFKNESDFDKAAAVFGMISQDAAPSVPEVTRRRAESEFNAILGKGPSGMRLTVLADRFVGDSLDWKIIVPMIGASTVGHLVGTAALSGLLRTGGEAWYSRGMGARFAAAFTGYTAEFTSFAAANRALATHAEGAFSDDLWRAAIAIGALKSTGFAGNKIFQKLHGFSEFGVPARLGGLAKFNQVMIPQFSMFTGMMASHKIETRLELRPHTDDGTLVTDTLSSMFSLGVGMHGASRLLGPGYRKFQIDLAMRAESYSRLADTPWLQNIEAIRKKFSELLTAPSMMAAVEGPGGLMMPMAIVDLDGAPGGKLPGVSAPRPETRDLDRVIPHPGGAGFPFKIRFSREADRLFGSPATKGLQGQVLEIGEREGRTLEADVEKLGLVVDGDPITPDGATTVRFRLREGETRGKAFVHFNERTITLYFIDLEDSRITGGPPMSPGAGSVFMTWLGEQAKRQGKKFNVTRITNPQTVKILERQGLVDPETSTVEACTRINPEGYDEEFRVNESFPLKDREAWKRNEREADFFNIIGQKPAVRRLAGESIEVTSLLKAVPSGKEIREQGLLAPVINPAGLLHTPDALLNQFVAEGSQFLEIGYGDRLETMWAAERLGAKVHGLELNRVFPPGASRERVAAQPADLLFLNQQNPIYYRLENITIPNVKQVIQKVAQAKRVMIQSYDPRSPLEILRHAEKIHGIKYRILYFQGKAGEGPLFSSAYGEDPKLHNTVLVAERMGEAPAGEVAGKARDVAAETAATPKLVPLDRRLAAEVSSLREQVHQLPDNNPLKESLEASLHQIHQEGYDPAQPNEFHRNLGRLEIQLGVAWKQSLEHRAQAVRPFLLKLAAEYGDKEFASAVEKVFTPKAFEESDFAYLKADFVKLSDLVRDAFSLAIRHEWSARGLGKPPPALMGSLHGVVANILRLDMLRSSFDPAVFRNFISEVVTFYYEHPPASLKQGLSLVPDDVALNPNLLHRAEFDAEGYLRSIAQNLSGHRRLFGQDAGRLFYGTESLISPIPGADGQPSPYYLAVERGQHEFNNGIRLAIFEGKPTNLQHNSYLAKIGINFDGDVLRVVNVQGPNKFYFSESLGKPAELLKLEAFFGGNGAMDMLLAAGILLGKNAGFEKIVGIRDGAQLSREKIVKNKSDKGFYDLTFRKFGFHPPREGGDFWSLDLNDLGIYRKKSALPLGAEGGEVLTPEQYFEQVLTRRNRDAGGKSVRPEKWDKQAPQPSDPAVVAFWKGIVPAFSNLEFSPGLSATTRTAPSEARPFQLQGLHTSRATREFFRQFAGESGKTDLADPFETVFQRVLEQGARGQISPVRAQIELTEAVRGDWNLELETYKPEKREFSVGDLWREIREAGSELPEWVERFERESPAREAKITEYLFDDAAVQRIESEGVGIQKNFAFSLGICALLEESLKLPKGSLVKWEKGDPVMVRVPSAEFIFEAVRRNLPAEGGPEIEMTGELVSMSQLRDLLEQNRRPVLFSRRHQKIHEEEDIHPYIVLIHDLYHLMRIAQHSSEGRKNIVAISEMLDGLQPSRSKERSWLRGAQELILDGDPDGHESFPVFFVQIPWSKFSAEFSASLENGMKAIFPEGERAERVMRNLYRHGAREQFLIPFQKQLNKDATVLKPDSKNALVKVLESALKQNIPVEFVAPSLFRLLGEDFIEQLKDSGAKSQTLSLSEDKLNFSLPVAEDPIQVKDLALREFFISAKTLKTLNADPKLAGQLTFLFGILRSLQIEMRIPEFTLFEQDAQGVILRFPATDILWDAAEILQGDQAIGRKLEVSVATDERNRDAMAIDLRPTVLSAQAQDLHDFKGLHPFVAALHDVYHTMKLSRMPREMRRNLVRINDALQDHAARPGERELVATLQHGLMDGNFGLHADFVPLFRVIAGHAPSEAFLKGLELSLQRRLADSPGGPAILEAFARELKPRTPPNGGGSGTQGSAALGALAVVPAFSGEKAKTQTAQSSVELRSLEAPPPNETWGSGAGLELGLALMLGMAFFGKKKPKALPPGPETTKALEKVPPAGENLPVLARQKPGMLSRLRGEFDKNDEPFFVGTAAGPLWLLGEIWGGLHFEHPVFFGISLAISLFSAGKLLGRRNRVERLLKGEPEFVTPPQNSKGEGPYRDTGIPPVSEQDLQRVRQLRYAVSDADLHPAVREEKLEELKKRWKEIDPSHPEFHGIQNDLLALIRNPKVVRPLGLLDEGTSVEPEKTRQTLAASLELRCGVVEAILDVLSNKSDPALREKLAEAMRQVLEKPRLPKPSVLAAILPRNLIWTVGDNASGITYSMAREEHSHGISELRKKLFPIYRDQVEQLPADHSEHRELEKLAKSDEFQTLGRADPEFRKQLKVLPEIPAPDPETILLEPPQARVAAEEPVKLRVGEEKAEENPAEIDKASAELNAEELERDQAAEEDVGTNSKKAKILGPGGGFTTLLAAGFGLGTLLHSSDSWAGQASRDLESGGSNMMIGLGLALGTGMAIGAYRWWASRRIQPAVEQNAFVKRVVDHYEGYFSVRLNENERNLLKPFFPENKEVPEVFGIADYFDINTRLIRSEFRDGNASVSHELLVVYDRFTAELHNAAQRAGPLPEPISAVEGPLDPNFAWVSSALRNAADPLLLTRTEQHYVREIFDRQASQLQYRETPERLTDDNVVILARLLVSETAAPVSRRLLTKIYENFPESLRVKDPALFAEVRARIETSKSSLNGSSALGLSLIAGLATLAAPSLAEASSGEIFAPGSPSAPWILGGMVLMSGWFGRGKFSDWVKGLLRYRFEADGFLVKEDPPEKLPQTPAISDSQDRKKLPSNLDKKTPPASVVSRKGQKKFPSGWVKQRRAEIEEMVNDPKINVVKKNLEIWRFGEELFEGDWDSASASEGAYALWNLSRDPRLWPEVREPLYEQYREFIDSEYFPTASPQLYREAFRLRRIFGNSRQDLDTRMLAAEAYADFIRRFDLGTRIGRGEAHEGALALTRLFDEVRPKLGRVEIAPLLTAIKNLRLRGIL